MAASALLRCTTNWLQCEALPSPAEIPPSDCTVPIADICGNEAIPLDVLLNIFDKRSRIIFFVFFPNLLNSRSSHHLAA